MTGVLLRRGDEDKDTHRGKTTQRKDHAKTQEDDHLQTKEGGLIINDAADTMILDF